MKLPSGRRYSALVQPHPRLNKNMNVKNAEPLPYRNSYTPSSKSFLNDPDCITLRERLLQGDDPDCLSLDDENKTPTITIDLLQRLIIHLREYEERCAASANYQDAKKIHTIQLAVKEKIKSYMQSQFSDSILSSNISSNSRNNTDYMENLRKKHEQELIMFDDETKEKINYIKKLHKQSLERFEQSWADKPRQYRKPSQHLIELKKTEQALAKIGQYDIATQVNIEAATRAKEEAAEKQKKIVDDYKNAKKKLLEKQNRELQSMIDNRADQRRIIESKQQRENESANNRCMIKEHHSQLIFNSSSKVLGSAHNANSRSSSNVGTTSSNISSMNVPSTKKAFVIPSYVVSKPSMRCRIYSLPPSAKANIWANNVINGTRSSSVSNSEQQNSNSILDQQPALLPPLIPPTDPSIIENEQKEKKEKIKLVQQAAIRREKEKRRRLELMQEEMAREKQIQEQQKRKIQIKNNKKKKEVNSSINEDETKETTNSTEQTADIDDEDNSKTDISNNINNGIEDEDNSKTDISNNLNADAAEDDSEYYYYEEEEEIIEEEESKEDNSTFVPMTSSCGSSSFHEIPSLTTQNSFAEACEAISKINKSKSKNDISNHKKNSKTNNSDKNKTNNDDTDTDDEIKINGRLKSKNNLLENKLYDQTDPLFRSVPSFKAIKEKTNDELTVAPKNFRRFLSSTSNNSDASLFNQSGLTSTSMSDFEMDSIPLDVTSFINGSFTDTPDFTLNIPFDDDYLNSIEGRPTVLSQDPSTRDIKELTKQIVS